MATTAPPAGTQPATFPLHGTGSRPTAPCMGTVTVKQGKASSVDLFSFQGIGLG
jgi:hypothetical protein